MFGTGLGLRMSARDFDRERVFLTAAARGHHELVEHATARLAAGEDVYGDRWTVGIRTLLGELSEEAADLLAWGSLADQALDFESLTEAQREQVCAVLHLAARHGAQAHRALATALRVLDAEALV